MRKELFNAIKAKLASDVPEVQHIDLWNHNVEFGKIEWSPFQGGSQRGKGLVTIHLVTDWADGGHDAAFDLCHQVHTALDGLSGDDFNGMALVETNTNHNHEEILESIDCYAVRYLLR